MNFAAVSKIVFRSVAGKCEKQRKDIPEAENEKKYRFQRFFRI